MAKVLIIGGGIAGPVTAIALRKAGIEATVYEAHATADDDAGAFLTLGVNGLEALNVVGLVDTVYAAGEPARRIEVLDADGSTISAGGLNRADTSELVPQTFKRAALHRVLAEAAENHGITVERGRRLVGGGLTDTGVRAEFADGGSATGDLLIGADGINSVTRRLIDPAAPEPRYAGQHIVYGFCDRPPTAVATDTYKMIRGSRAMFGVVGGPDDTLWWFARVFGEPMTRDEAAARTAADWRDRLVELFRDDRTPAADIVAATDRIAGRNNYDIPSVPTWHNGRMTIAGDAAHAASPSAAQGASMAAEDAIVLAKCLRDIPDAERAFAAYEQLRRPRVELVVEVAATISGRPAARPTSGDWLSELHLDWETQITDIL